MKQQYIHSTIDATGSALSLGSYWACNGRSPIETPWEFIGDEQGLYTVLDTLRGECEVEFMHIINRTTHR